jgi:hypothetical protein
MRYDFECDDCGLIEEVLARAFHPPAEVKCPECQEPMDRVFGCQIDTSKCQDPDEIPPQHRVTNSKYGIGEHNAQRLEKAYADDIKRKRDEATGESRMGHSVPAHLYHGKIRQTGDKAYWRDPANLKRHTSCEIKRRK